MRILISGAAGFIGSHLADALLAQGHEVIGIDNFATGRQSNIAHLATNPRFQFINHDIINPLPSWPGNLDRIFHLASPASPQAYRSQRVNTMKVNSAGAWNLLDLACEKGARFLVASTSEIYGDPQKSIQKEEDWGNVNPIGTRSMYEEAKRFSEALCMAYHREKNADTRIVRIFNTYGPRMRPADGRVVSTFIQSALKGEDLPISGDGMQFRAFCYVSDTLAGIIGASEADFHEPINIGNPHETPILELARTIIDLIPGTKSKIAFSPKGDYDPLSRCPDISRAKLILDWSPRVPLREGLANVIEHYRNLEK
jgi:dTDP-glucose 4,6-dehydratase